MITEYFISHLGYHLWPTFLAIAILEGIIVYTWQFRKSASARFLMYVQSGQLLWLLATLLARLSQPLALRIFWLGFLQIESLFTCTLWYQFVLEMSGYRRKLPRWPLYGMWATVAVFAVLLFTNPWHHAYWMPITGTPEEQKLQFGWAGNLETLAAYSMLAISLAVALCWYRKMPGLNRQVARLALIGGMISWAGHLLTLFPSMAFLAPLPLCFALSGLIIGWAYHRWRPFNILPMAQEMAVAAMIDGFMVVDEASYIIAVNPMLQTFLSGLKIAADQRYESLLTAWPELRRLDAEMEIEASRKVYGRLMYFRVSRMPLRTPTGKALGMMMLFADITLEKARHAQLLEQHEAEARMAERAMLGRELHDGSGQIWSFVDMQLETALHQLSLWQIDPVRRTLERTLESVQSTQLNLRESITSLQTRLSGADGLQRAMQEQIRWYEQQCAQKILLQSQSVWPEALLMPTIKVQLLRIFQESLANIRKYAQAEHVLITLSAQAGWMKMRIEDDGCGFDKAELEGLAGHHGLRIMRERASQIGAHFEFDSTPQRGTSITITVPVKQSVVPES